MDFLSNIISGIIGGLIVYFVQLLAEKQKKKNEDQINRIVGKPTLKYLDSDFLYNYTPGKVSIEKIFNDFGEPFTKSKVNLEDDDRLLSFYKYILKMPKLSSQHFKTNRIFYQSQYLRIRIKKIQLIAYFFQM